jgi:hypothetical protein
MHKVILRYVVWGLVLAVLETYLLVGNGEFTHDFITIAAINAFVLYVVENLTAKFLYGDYRYWDMSQGFLPEISICDCEECTEWRKNNQIKLFRNRLIISILTFLFIGLFFLHKKIEEIQETSEEIRVVQIEDRIDSVINNYFDSLKIEGDLPKYINPEFNIETKKVGDNKIVTANYSYLTTDEEFSTEIYDYCSGCYLYSQSKAASQMLIGVQKSVNIFLEKNLESGEEIQITLAGFSDGARINSRIPYNGEFGNFPTRNDDTYYTSYILNGKPEPLNLKSGDAIDNPKLAFLRAYSIKEFLDNYIPKMRKVKKKYAFYAQTEKDPKLVGGKFRKVKLSISIINPVNIVSHENNSEEIKATEKKTNFLDLIATIISILIIPFMGKLLEYHYKAWRDAERKGEPYQKDRNTFFFLLLATVGAVCMVFYFASSIAPVLKVF